MLKGIQIMRIGLLVTALALLVTHTTEVSHGLTAFSMGMGCSLSLVGAGKRARENQ